MCPEAMAMEEESEEESIDGHDSVAVELSEDEAKTTNESRFITGGMAPSTRYTGPKRAKIDLKPQVILSQAEADIAENQQSGKSRKKELKRMQKEKKKQPLQTTMDVAEDDYDFSQL